MKLFAQTSRTTWAKCALGVAILVPILIGIESLRYFQYAPAHRFDDPGTFRIMVKIVLLLCGVLFGSALGMFIRKKVVFVLSLLVFLFAGLVSCIVLFGLESNIRADKWNQAELARIGERHELEVQIEEAQAAAEAAKAEAAAAKAEAAALKAAAAKSAQTAQTAKPASSGSAARPAAKASASKSSVSAAAYEQAIKGDALVKEKKYAEAIPCYEKAESLTGGADFIEYTIGWCYEKLEDYARALPWFRKAAEKGDAEAQYYLGRFYYYGQGVAEDYATAVKWFRKAAEQGDAESQGFLAMCYLRGDGVEEDEETAKMWYRKAAAQGGQFAKMIAPWFE